MTEMIEFMSTWRRRSTGEPLAPTTQLSQFTGLNVASTLLMRTLTNHDKFVLKREKRRIDKLLAQYSPKRAYPLKLPLLKEMLGAAKVDMRMHLHVAWIMGLRLGTLEKIHKIILHRTTFQTPIAGWKGRDLALQNKHKFAPLNAELRQFFKRRRLQLQSAPIGTPIFNIKPAAIIRYMKTFDNRLSGHSPRRGAARHLSNLGVPLARIKDFLTHKSENSTRLYVDPSPSQPEAREDIELSRLTMARK
jgi:integrase